MAQKVNIDISTRGARKAKQDMSGISSSISKMGKAVGIATTAYFGARGLIEGISKVVTLSSELEGVERGFNNLAKASGFSTNTIGKLQKATDGTMSSMELMTQANNMMLLGITDSEDQMAEMFDTAQRLASALGKDTAFGVESLTTGLGRQSKLMLDNLGIMLEVDVANQNYADAVGKTVSELDDQEKKQAFVNEAMSQAKELIKNVGEEQLTTKDSIAQMNTALTELGTVIGDSISPAVIAVSKIVVAFADGLSDIINFRDNLQKMAVDFKILTESEVSVINLTNSIGEMTKPEIVEKLKELGVGIGSVNDSTAELVMTKVVLNEADKANLQMQQALFDAYKDAPEAIDLTLTAFDKYLAKQQEVALSQKLEQEHVNKLKEEYPELAKSIGLANDKSKEGAKVEKDRFQSTLGGIRNTIKGYLAQSIASMIAIEAGTKGLGAIITGTIGAVAITELFENVVPKFADGGIVKGNPQQGDVQPAMLTAGELILNQAQQENLLSNGGITINISAPLVDETVVDSIMPAIERAKRMNLA